jgi:hypothetical protein
MTTLPLPAMKPIAWSRYWAMPSPHTFTIKPIKDLLNRYISDGATIVDPFCGDSLLATHRNDLSTGIDAEEFCMALYVTYGKEWADVILFDPPYSPRQISSCYKSIGLSVGQQETQNGHLYKRVRNALLPLLRKGGIAVSFGWNSCGFGLTTVEIMLVSHGGAHNDTIVLVEQK